MRHLRRLPIASCTVVLLSVALSWFPDLAVRAQLDWAAVGDGQWWRLWTGHLTHWTGEHLFWDVLAFLALGILCEREHRRTFVMVLAVGLPIISVGLAIVCPEITIYRGLSGIDTGLFVWWLMFQCQRAWSPRDLRLLALWSALLAGLVGKLMYEGATGSCLFVTTSPATFRPLVESHLLGAAIGCAAFAGHALRHRTFGVRVACHRFASAPASELA